jgi:hypothetical protein
MRPIRRESPKERSRAWSDAATHGRRYPSEMTNTGSIKSQLRQLARSHPDDDTGEVARLAAELADKIADLQMQVGALIEAVEEGSDPL